jgi:hypothetical protein
VVRVTAFLAGEGIVLSPYELADARVGASLPPRLLPGRPGPPERVLGFAARAPDGRFLGRVALEGVDWVARRARVTLRWGPDATLAPAALRLAARYARHDLNLETLEAEPADGAWARTLRDVGFEEKGALFVLALPTRPSSPTS